MSVGPTAARTPLRRLCCLLSVAANCLTAGSCLTYPLFMPPLADSLDLTSSQVALIASCGTTAIYFSAFPVGLLIDRQGGGTCSLFAAILYGTGYMGMYYVGLTHATMDKSVALLLLCVGYLLVGVGTTASYFSALITASKSASSRFAGVAIGVFSSIFALSSLVLSSIAASYFTTAIAPFDLDSTRWFLFLSLLLFTVNFLSSFGLVVIPPADLDSAFHSETNETTRLLASDRVDGNTRGEEEDGELKSNAEFNSLSLLLSSPSFWIFGTIMLLSTGPLEMMLVHIGGVIQSLMASASVVDTSALDGLDLRRQHVQLISVFNTASRIVIGALSDYVSRPASNSTAPRFSRLSCMAIVCSLLAVVFAYSAEHLKEDRLWVLSISIGASYGSLFTLAPAIIRTLYPDTFGSAYGIFSWFSAVGALIFTPLFGFLADRVAAQQGRNVCEGIVCFSAVFYISSASVVLSIVLCFVLLNGYWKGRV